MITRTANSARSARVVVAVQRALLVALFVVLAACSRKPPQATPEGAVRELGPVTAHGAVEARAARRIDRKIHRVGIVGFEPFDVGPKSHASGEIERQMHAEPARLRDRIDESGKARRSRMGEIGALGEEKTRSTELRDPADRRGDRVRPRSCRKNEMTRRNGQRSRGRRRLDLEFLGFFLAATQTVIEKNRASPILDLAKERQHQTMGIDEAGFADVKGEGCAQGGLQLFRRRCVQQRDILHLVSLGLPCERDELLRLGVIRGDDELPAQVSVEFPSGGAYNWDADCFETLGPPPNAGTDTLPEPQ